MNMTINHWDWTVIIIYFAFIVGIGFLFKSINKSSSDYFRGGGNMLWWMAGMSAIASSISTWSFSAASAKVYDSGFLLPMTWVMGTPITILILWYFAPRFRQMRVITSLEAVAKRFGFGSEQFFVYLALPMGIIWGGVGAASVAVFFGTALDVSVPLTLVSVISIVTVMSLFGGKWAVAASDFVQGLLMFLTVLVVVFFSLRLPEIGGLFNLHNSLPERHFDFSKGSRIEIVVMWIVVMQVMSIFSSMNLSTEGGKYISVKDGREAKRMLIMRFVLFCIIPIALIMQLPAICAATVFPDMAAIYPDMKAPTEGAFLAMAFKVMPQGMMGLLICGMFAAAMSSMDSSLNGLAAVFTRNVYIKYINKSASEKKQLFMGRVFTLSFGFAIIICGLYVETMRSLDMFSIFQLLNSMLWVPTLVPVSLGLVFKKTPGWSAWSSVLVGMGTASLSKMAFKPEYVQWVMDYDSPLNQAELIDSEFIFVTLMVVLVTSTWFFFTTLFYDKCKDEFKQGVDSFFKDMDTPIDHVKEDVENQDAIQYRLVGIACLAFGSFVLLGMLIPNPLYGRICFLFVGGIIFGIGLLLYYLSKRVGNISVS